MARFAIWVASEASIGRKVGIVEIVHDGGRGQRALETHECHRPGRRRETEVGVQGGGCRLARFSISPHGQEPLGRKKCAGGKLPLSQIGIVFGEVEGGEIDRRGARVIELDERIVVACVVDLPVHVVGQNFVEPEQRESSQTLAGGIGSAGGDAVQIVRGGGRPIGDAVGIPCGIDQLERRPEPIGHERPRQPAIVANIVDHQVAFRRQPWLDQPQVLSSRTEGAGELIEHRDT